MPPLARYLPPSPPPDSASKHAKPRRVLTKPALTQCCCSHLQTRELGEQLAAARRDLTQLQTALERQQASEQVGIAPHCHALNCVELLGGCVWQWLANRWSFSVWSVSWL